jgi:hypothetical protein
MGHDVGDDMLRRLAVIGPLIGMRYSSPPTDETFRWIFGVISMDFWRHFDDDFGGSDIWL